nr:hypothetical protein Iba_chr10eCG7070 [Ipomoea batatas]GMD79737.1 hypothetical protein Iba_chr13dCG6850 [Ipomoea batatas]GMD82617.1 hypothetical protein Iba_chr13fCG9790 [Ipomoea batatas]GME05534.1 hypothetical protein Iba_scaffold3049CG0690 [Ipomoea batatas]
MGSRNNCTIMGTPKTNYFPVIGLGRTPSADQLRCRSAAEEELPHLQLAFVMTSTDPPVACLEVSREVLREAEKRGRSLSSRHRSGLWLEPSSI